MHSKMLVMIGVALLMAACTPTPTPPGPTPPPSSPVGGKPVISNFRASPEGVQTPGTVTLSWEATGASTLSIDSGVGAVDGATNSRSVQVNATTVFTLTATNAQGSTTKSVIVDVGVPDKLPILKVTDKPSPATLTKLAEALGLPDAKPDANGKLVYTSPDFQKLPVTDGGQGENGEGGTAETTTITNFDFGAIKKLQVIDGTAALDKFRGALGASGVNLAGASPSVDYSRFRATDKSGAVQVDELKIDTQVNFDLKFNNYEVVGPGAKLKAAFGPGGAATQVVAALRGVTNGEPRPIISRARARLLALQNLRAEGLIGKQDLGKIDLGEPKIVYYAPDLDVTPDALYPHYRFTPRAQVGGETVPLRTLLIPATVDAPKLDLSLPAPNSDYYVSDASVKIAGGTAPYKVEWTSSTVGSVPTRLNSTTVSYSLLRGRPAEADPNNKETLQVTVTDANGLSVTTSQTVDAPLPSQGPGLTATGIGTQQAGRYDVGTEWINACGGLGQAGNNAAGFVNRMGAFGIPTQFNWGENNAWERDFKRGGLGNGQASSYADDVDMVFYTGHANGNGWSFCNLTHDNTFVDYNETQYGKKELEWLVIAACGPLQLSEGGKAWYERWGPTFRGLHLIMGYANVSGDTANEGRDLANRAMAGEPLRTAWINTAVANQPSSVTWSVMGVYGPGGRTSYDDHFWGKGAVSPDMGYDASDGKGTLYDGWWLIWGPS